MVTGREPRLSQASDASTVLRWSVYVVRCGDGALYTGIATDVARRIAEHRQNGGRGARYLRGRGPLELVFQRELGDRGLALRVEDRIKKLPKVRKERLLVDSTLMEKLVADAGEGANKR